MVVEPHADAVEGLRLGGGQLGREAQVAVREHPGGDGDDAVPGPEGAPLGVDRDALAAPADPFRPGREKDLQIPPAVGQEGAVAFLAVPVRPVFGVPPVHAREVVEVLAHLPGPDHEMHQVVPLPGVGNDGGRAPVLAPPAGGGHRPDGAGVGGPVGGVLRGARLAVSAVERLAHGGRVGVEALLPGVAHEGVVRGVVQPVRPQVAGDPEEARVGVRPPADPAARLHRDHRHAAFAQDPGRGQPGRPGPDDHHVGFGRRRAGAGRQGQRGQRGAPGEETPPGKHPGLPAARDRAAGTRAGRRAGGAGTTHARRLGTRWSQVLVNTRVSPSQASRVAEITNSSFVQVIRLRVSVRTRQPSRSSVMR